MTEPNETAEPAGASGGSMAWIPVAERLPEDREQCLVAHEGSIGIAWWHSTPPQFVHEDIDNFWTPTHWMPLPAPPTDAK